MSLIRGKLADHVGDHVVLSPEGAVLVSSTGTESSYPRPPHSLNDSSLELIELFRPPRRFRRELAGHVPYPRYAPRSASQPLQFPPSADRTAATQLLIRSMRDALSGIFDVADPTGTGTLTWPVWVPGWHAPLFKLIKAAMTPNRDHTHVLHRLVDDLFSQLQERMASVSSGPAAFKTLLADFRRLL